MYAHLYEWHEDSVQVQNVSGNVIVKQTCVRWDMHDNLTGLEYVFSLS